MKLSDIMTTSVEIIPPDCLLQEAARKMGELDVGALPICDGDKIQGIVTDRDIVIRAIGKGMDVSQTPVIKIISSPIVYVFEDATPEEAVRLMEVKQIRRLVVLNHDKKLVGIVTLGDIAVKTSEMLAGEALEKISEPVKGKAA